MTKAQAAELLEMLIAQGPALRKAGFARVELAGIAFSLRPAEPEASPAASTTTDDEEPVDALHDEATFGGRRVPGNPRRGVIR
jgi:hypothetical protein